MKNIIIIYAVSFIANWVFIREKHLKEKKNADYLCVLGVILPGINTFILAYMMWKALLKINWKNMNWFFLLSTTLVEKN